MTSVLLFAAGMAAMYAVDRVLTRLAKTAIGKRAGIGADSRKKWLAESDHDALLLIRSDLERELERRRASA